MTKKRDPLAAWPIIDGPLCGQVRAWPADFFYALERPPVVVTPCESLPRCDDGARRTEYRLRVARAGGFVWSCAAQC